MTESVSRTRGQRKNAKENGRVLLESFRHHAQTAEKAFETDERLREEYASFAAAFFDIPIRTIKNREWGSTPHEMAAWLQSRYPHGLPTAQMLINGSSAEQILWRDTQRKKLLGLFPKYQANQYATETIKTTATSATIVWKGREEEAFKEKYGDVTPGKVANFFGKEGARDYKRLMRARKRVSRSV